MRYPDFDTIPQAPGTASFVTLSYDIDAAGKTRHVRIVESDGNAALDGAAIAALRGNRFNDRQPKVGCVTHFYRRAPAEGPAPTFDWKKPENADCKLGEWIRKPNTVFPVNYGRRGVSGRAVLSFDVAPWGAIGNIKVIASEPGSAFGEAARNALANAMQAPSSRGSTGCTQTFSFNWRDNSASSTAD